jgi:hypothetical protein
VGGDSNEFVSFDMLFPALWPFLEGDLRDIISQMCNKIHQELTLIVMGIGPERHKSPHGGEYLRTCAGGEARHRCGEETDA